MLFVKLKVDFSNFLGIGFVLMLVRGLSFLNCDDDELVKLCVFVVSVFIKGKGGKIKININFFVVRMMVKMGY